MLVNGRHSNTISVDDRGLLYGDGVFETILCERGKPVLFDGHIKRLQQGCHCLGLTQPKKQLILDEVIASADNSDCVVKVVLTRGVRKRGYYYDKSDATSTRIIQRSELPKFPKAFYREGIKLYLCQYRLPNNNQLAGIKHLNRLDQVIARAEWESDYQEGVMLNQSEQVIEGTMSNIFVHKDNTWLTPYTNQAGVKGVLRDFVLESAKDLNIIVKEADLTIKDLQQADSMFICNSVIGIWPVKVFQGNNYKTNDEMIFLMQFLHKNVSALYLV